MSGSAGRWRFWTPPQGSIPTLSTPSIEGVRSVHLLGIGGAGMRNLARLFVARGLAVSGSDVKDSLYLTELGSLGVRIHVGHDPALLGSPDVVVVSSAIRDDNPEVAAAARSGIPIWKRQQAIGALAAGHRTIAISGAHGKTTTTSLIAATLEAAGLDPTKLIGGDLNESGSGARHGTGDLFVFEADESDGSFLMIPPWVGVITNLDADHLDFYPRGLGEIEDAFAEFAVRCDQVVACGDDPSLARALARAGVRATTYGSSPGCDLQLRVDFLGPEGARGTVLVDEAEVPLRLRVDGAHNLLNATAAVATAALVGVAPSVAAEALAGFTGVRRRFELRGSARGADFYDDYGHVPVELAVTLGVARRTGPARLMAFRTGTVIPSEARDLGRVRSRHLGPDPSLRSG